MTPGGAALPGREPPFSIFTAPVVTQLVRLVAATFLWNLLVLVTILRVRALHRVPHNVVASTAVSDELVAALVHHAPEPGERAVGRATVAAGPELVPRVDLLRRAALPRQHLERGGHRPGPILDHQAPPAVHAAHPPPSLGAPDRAHLGPLRAHRPRAAALRLGRGERRSAPALLGEPGTLLRRLLHLGRLLPASGRGAICPLEDIQGGQVSRRSPPQGCAAVARHRAGEARVEQWGSGEAGRCGRRKLGERESWR